MNTFFLQWVKLISSDGCKTVRQFKEIAVRYQNARNTMRCMIRTARRPNKHLITDIKLTKITTCAQSGWWCHHRETPFLCLYGCCHNTQTRQSQLVVSSLWCPMYATQVRLGDKLTQRRNLWHFFNWKSIVASKFEFPLNRANQGKKVYPVSKKILKV